MSEFKDDTFLSRWINNELSTEELNTFRKSENYNTYRKILEGTELIDSNAFDEKLILQKIKAQSQSARNMKKSTGKVWAYSIAASIVILLSFLSYNIYFSTDLTTYKSTIGEKMNIELPDGSSVTLNANSSLSFYTDDWASNREIDLKGEGYFKVKKGSRFTVKSKAGVVTVLGTEFSIKELDGFYEVLCFEGSVKVSTDQENEILKPKTGVRKTRNAPLLTRNILLDKPAWLANKSSFTSVQMSYVLMELNNQYGVQFDGQELVKELSFNGTFPHDNLDLALKIVLGPIDVNYEKKGNVVVLSRD